MSPIPEPDVLARIERGIADAIFRWIAPDADYVVVRAGKARNFTTARLLNNRRVRLVGHRDDAEGRIIRDYGIYRVVAEGPGHNEVTTQTATELFNEGAVTLCAGAELTVADVWSAAKMEVLSRIDTDET